MKPMMVKALYRKASLPENRGNRLIEALPHFVEGKAFIDDFGRRLQFDAIERAESSAYRMEAVTRLNDYLEPLTGYLELIESLQLSILRGYAIRNPDRNATVRDMNRIYRQVMIDGKVAPIMPSYGTSTLSSSLLGISGMGKTTVVERFLHFLPQVINHQNGMVQITWLKMDCAGDANIKQFFRDILIAIDRILGTEYERMNRAITGVDALMSAATKTCLRHHLGILVIDEIQHLMVDGGVGRTKMLNFLLTLSNVLRIPILIIGTPLATRIFDKGPLRNARRAEDFGSRMWNNLLMNKEWCFFLQQIEKYQWTRKPVAYDGAIREVIYSETQGVLALAVRLIQFAQLEAIRSGKETITKVLLRDVARSRFKLVQPMLSALRTGKKIDEHEDLFGRRLKEMAQEVKSEGALPNLQELAKGRCADDDARMKAVASLVGLLGCSLPDAEEKIDGVFSANPGITARAAVFQVLAASDDFQLLEQPPRMATIAGDGSNSLDVEKAMRATGLIATD